ncbi:MAG: hypothetical protein EZS28_007254 [Streblomastix strix]|uniref:Uncharacterized protein n=1 Tax=Streblomastix strix TaxID=222440 RepID=A0A5J4WQJ5_9EUKA|nr:MAG: hypothetical protein EZS28_007254 [Streblomastix strix]
MDQLNEESGTKMMLQSFSKRVKSVAGKLPFTFPRNVQEMTPIRSQSTHIQVENQKPNDISVHQDPTPMPRSISSKSLMRKSTSNLIDPFQLRRPFLKQAAIN